MTPELVCQHVREVRALAAFSPIGDPDLKAIAALADLVDEFFEARRAYATAPYDIGADATSKLVTRLRQATQNLCTAVGR